MSAAPCGDEKCGQGRGDGRCDDYQEQHSTSVSHSAPAAAALPVAHRLAGRDHATLDARDRARQGWPLAQPNPTVAAPLPFLHEPANA